MPKKYDMTRLGVLLPLFFVLSACNLKEHGIRESTLAVKGDPNEITNFYSEPKTEMVYSEFVSDSFKIFSSLPSEYYQDATSTYPLLLVLDANAYFESVVAELKLGTLTQGLPKSIVVGIGYKGFWAMDSLRDRDYTHPKALPEDSFRISGGAEKFKRFIDIELLPKIFKQFRIDQNQIVLMGHSLGGYFVLYYLFDSLEKREGKVRNFISVSPALGYHNQYLLTKEKDLGLAARSLPIKLFASTGSAEYESNHENLFSKLTTQVESYPYREAKVKFVEFGNFDHMDSAMPGFMKGLIFVFEE